MNARTQILWQTWMKLSGTLLGELKKALNKCTAVSNIKSTRFKNFTRKEMIQIFIQLKSAKQFLYFCLTASNFS